MTLSFITLANIIFSFLFPADINKNISPAFYPLENPHSKTQKEWTLFEADSSVNSQSPYLWLDSGGIFKIKDGIGKTNQGRLPYGSVWQKEYEIFNFTLW